MRLVGANPMAAIAGLDELPGKSNYFIGNDPAQWRTNVRNYSRVRYQDVFPGIDLVYYGREGQLEYDFNVRPGADPSAIRMSLAGAGLVPPRRTAQGTRAPQAAPLRGDANDDLVVRIDGGEVRFHKPIVYQLNPDGSKHFIDGRYVVANPKSKIQNLKSAIHFRIAAYDKTRPLIIDPTLTYSTYLGGSSSDIGYGIAVDGGGDAFITGQTCSANFPTAAPEQAASGGNCDAFVTEINPAGTALVYSTYLGGSGGDYGASIAIDANGNAYLTGFTNSTNFPTTAGALQTAYGGGDSDAFVTKLNSSGSALVYSTYLGGSDADTAAAVALDTSNDAVVAGQTCSVNFPLFNQLPQDFLNLINVGANCDAFVTKLNPSGSGLIFSTYLGGAGTDAAYGVAVDSQGAAFATGSTDSINFPLQDAIQPAFGGSPGSPQPLFPGDAFVSKIQPGGSALVYSTFLGGAAADAGYGIAVDNLGNAYVAGFTTSGNFPITPGALSTTLGGTTDAFVSKLNPLGSALAYSTYLGGSGVDEAFAIAVDINGIAHVTGGTTSSDFPTVGALQPNLNGPLVFPGDAFVAKVDAFGSGLVYSSFLGGGDLDAGNSIAVDSSLGVYVAGSTASVDFPTTTGAFQTAPGGVGDAFVTKLENLTAPVAIVSPRTLAFASQGLGISSAPQTVTITNSGDASLTISQIIESGGFSNPTPPAPPVDLNDWKISSDNCTGSTVAPAANCTFTVIFNPNPALEGARSGTITITDNATSSTQVINLSGDGVPPPAVSVLPASLSFANQLSGTTSPAQTVTFTNTGGFVLAISSIAITGDFAETNTCGSSVGAGASCTFTVTFSPTTSGAESGTISVNDDATPSPQTLNLTGAGTAPVVTLAPASLAFSSQAVGTTSALTSATLTNTGTAALNITGITLTGTNATDFALAQTCGSSLAVNAGCGLNVTFSPSAAGPRVASVSIADNAAGSPQTILLTGTGILLPVASLAPASLTFASQKVATTSAAQKVTLTNTGTAPLAITGIAAAPADFALTSTCGASVAVKASCTMSITFAPTAVGNRSGAVTVTDNATDSPQTVVLAGVGLAAPIVTLSAASLTFSGQAVGVASAPQTVTLTNGGSATLNISSISTTGDFAENNTCPPAVPAGGSCAANVTFTPTTAGTRTGSLTFTDDASGSPQTVTLGGIGADFALAAAPPSTTVLAGNPAAFTITVTPNFGFNGMVTFTCSGLPALSTCSASPGSVAPNGGPATATLTVTTTARSLLPPWPGPRGGWRCSSRWRSSCYGPGAVVVARATPPVMAQRLEVTRLR